MRSNCAASSLSKSGSKTSSFLGRDWLGDGANLDGWDADIVDSLVKSVNSSRFADFWGCSINADWISVKRA